MFSLGAVLEKAKESAMVSQLRTMAKAAGLDAKLEPVPFPGRAAAFQKASRLANSRESDVFVLSGTDKKGGQIEALLIFSKKAS
jgi:hypothetical protein